MKWTAQDHSSAPRDAAPAGWDVRYFAAAISEADEVLHIGCADLQNAFYHLSLPVPLRRFFVLSRIRRSSVPADLAHLVPSMESAHFILCIFLTSGLTWV